MPKADTIAIFDRNLKTGVWKTPKVEHAHDFEFRWERDNMIMARESSLADGVIVSIDGTKKSMMATICLEDAIELRKQLTKAIAAVRKELK